MCRGPSNLAEEHQFVVAICLWKANNIKSRTQTPVYFCMNFVFKISQKRNQQSSSNFHSIFALMRNGYNNKIKLICGHLGYDKMQMKVTSQISFRFLSQQPFVRLSPIFVCIWSVTRQSYCIIRSS